MYKTIKIVDDISTLTAGQWNALNPGNIPFLNHEFLAAMEKHGCVGEQFGWFPCHIAAFDQNDQLIGAMPLYIKNNSYGELVFDWAWADAYQRQGLVYYPKLACAIPYTPATGPRLLVHPRSGPELKHHLIQAARRFAADQQMSSFHVLFLPESELNDFAQAEMFHRMGCQFHWHNRNYRHFEDFLSGFTSAKRKKMHRERRRVFEADVNIEVLHGHELNEPQWQLLAHFYRKTFWEKGGIDTFNLEFFKQIGRTMGSQLVCFFAKQNQIYVAVAICYRSDDTLYGRHWGCEKEIHSLHFELCYYQGIDYCIQQGLQHFEPGAQGEHKVARGFEPTATWSSHWIAHPRFDQIIRRHVAQENAAVADYCRGLTEHLPFKSLGNKPKFSN